MHLAVVNAIWIGPVLGQIHIACLRSFLRHGHRVVLHCYKRPKDTPVGIEIADAGKLLPEKRIIRHQATGSVALFSDLLRYEILGSGLGLYVDCDVFCLRPIVDADYIFGWESSTSIGSAVLKLPFDCPVLVALRAIKDTPNFVPPWQKGRKRRRLEWLRRPQPAKTLESLPWGTVGPRALTHCAKEHGIEHLASPIDRFYPVHWSHVELLFDRALSLQELTTHRTDALHLFTGSQQGRFTRNGIPTGSPLWQIIEMDTLKFVSANVDGGA